jgi:hypothetical protein
VYTGDQTPIGEATSNDTLDHIVDVQSADPGTYLIYVNSPYGRTSSVPYTLSIVAPTAQIVVATEVPIQITQTPVPSPSPVPNLATTPDAHTVLLDHFDGTTLGSGYGGGLNFSPGIDGLNSAVNLTAGSYIKYPLIRSLETEATVELLLKPRQFNASVLNFNWNDVFSAPSAGHVLHVKVQPDGAIAIGGWASDPACMYTLTSAGAMVIGQWNHIAVSWGTVGAKIYLNGLLSASSGQCFRPATPRWAYLNYWGASDLGWVDELHVSDRQRSDVEVAADASVLARR